MPRAEDFSSRLDADFIHDFNNFLVVIRGQGELLRNAAGPGTSERERADEILAAADGALRLTRQLLGEPAPAPASTAARGGNETVLLVEDDDGVRALVYEVLQEQGYAVLEAADGAAAFEVARAHGETIDLVVTDLVMPRLDGRALVTQLASLNPNLRVLAMSGYPDDSPAAKIAHREAFLRKPFTIEELTNAVRRLLDE